MVDNSGSAVADQIYKAAETHVRPERVDELFMYRDDDGRPSYYPGQREVICEIIQAFLDGKTTVLGDAPTGSGKSVIANTVMCYLGQGAWGATPKNVLVDQYEKIGWRTIRGLASYNCGQHRGNNCHKGTLLARAEGKIDVKESGCGPQCPAREAAKAFFDNDFEGGCMTNMHYLWHALRKFEKANETRARQLAVFDEAHMLEAALADMVSIVIKKEDLEQLGFTERLHGEKDIDRWLGELDEHLDGQVDELYATVGDLKRKHGKSHPSVRLHLARLEATQRKKTSVEGYTMFRNSTQWIRELRLDIFGNLEYLKVEPVYGGFLVQKCLGIAPHSLMLSATFLNKEMSCVEMHLDPAKVAFVQIPSYFPPENQPIYFDPALRLNMKNLETSLPMLVAKIDRILDYEQGKRGIIHSHSHTITRKIAEMSRHKRRFSIVEDGQKQLDAIQKHIDSKDSVLLGPGFVEGVDLKGDLGSFFITPKIPFPPMLGDKKLMIREKDHPGYCDLLTVRALIQGAGRVVRGAHEVANGYILDGSLYRLLNGHSLRFFPQSFLQKIRIANIQ